MAGQRCAHSHRHGARRQASTAKEGNHRRFKYTPEAWSVVAAQPRSATRVFRMTREASAPHSRAAARCWVLLICGSTTCATRRPVGSSSAATSPENLIVADQPALNWNPAYLPNTGQYSYVLCSIEPTTPQHAGMRAAGGFTTHRNELMQRRLSEAGGASRGPATLDP